LFYISLRVRPLSSWSSLCRDKGLRDAVNVCLRNYSLLVTSGSLLSKVIHSLAYERGVLHLEGFHKNTFYRRCFEKGCDVMNKDFDAKDLTTMSDEDLKKEVGLKESKSMSDTKINKKASGMKESNRAVYLSEKKRLREKDYKERGCIRRVFYEGMLRFSQLIQEKRKKKIIYTFMSEFLKSQGDSMAVVARTCVQRRFPRRQVKVLRFEVRRILNIVFGTGLQTTDPKIKAGRIISALVTEVINCINTESELKLPEVQNAFGGTDATEERIREFISLARPIIANHSQHLKIDGVFHAPFEKNDECKQEADLKNTASNDDDEDVLHHKLYSETHFFVPYMFFLAREAQRTHKGVEWKKKDMKKKKKKNKNMLMFDKPWPVKTFDALPFFKLKRRPIVIDSNTLWNILKIKHLEQKDEYGLKKRCTLPDNILSFLPEELRRKCVKPKGNLKTILKNVKHWEKRVIPALLQNHTAFKKLPWFKSDRTFVAFRIQTDGYKVRLFVHDPRTGKNEKKEAKEDCKEDVCKKKKKQSGSKRKRRGNSSSGRSSKRPKNIKKNALATSPWIIDGEKGKGFKRYNIQNSEGTLKHHENQTGHDGYYYLGVDPGHSSVITVAGNFKSHGAQQRLGTESKGGSKKLNKETRKRRQKEMGVSVYSLENYDWRLLTYSVQSNQRITQHKLNTNPFDIEKRKRLLREGTFLDTSRWVFEYLENFDMLYEQAMHPLLGLLGLKRDRALRKAYKKVAQGIRESVRKVLGPVKLKGKLALVWGSGGFGPTSRGWASAPNKKLQSGLQKFFPIISSTEFRTSRVCSKCQSEEDLKSGRGSYWVDGEKRKKEIRGLRHCGNCNTTWNRDVNAALNILVLFWFQVENPEATALPGAYRPRRNIQLEANA